MHLEVKLEYLCQTQVPPATLKAVSAGETDQDPVGTSVKLMINLFIWTFIHFLVQYSSIFRSIKEKGGVLTEQDPLGLSWAGLFPISSALVPLRKYNMYLVEGLREQCDLTSVDSYKKRFLHQEICNNQPCPSFTLPLKMLCNFVHLAKSNTSEYTWPRR